MALLGWILNLFGAKEGGEEIPIIHTVPLSVVFHTGADVSAQFATSEGVSAQSQVSIAIAAGVE